jgi:beta-phosphoglucomutase
MPNVAVIFDMDGVIADTNPTHLIAWKAYLAKYNIEASDHDLIHNMYGKANSVIMEYFFKRKMERAEIDQKQYEKEALFRDMYESVAQPLEGLLAFIDDLKANGVKTGIATSAPVENLELILSKIPLHSKMESMMSNEDVTQHKPDPEVYLKTANRLGVLPEHCVVFEDSFSGITAGLAAGAKVVGVLTSHQPDELPVCHAYIFDYKGIDFEFIQQLLAS